MKGYLQSLLGSLTALLILAAWALIAVVVLIGVIASLADQPPIEIPEDSVLVIDLNTTIYDAPPISDFESALQDALSAQPQSATYLLKVLENIERAASDDAIAAILLHGSLQEQGYGSGLAAIAEVRNALENFQASGKPVYAYLISPTQKDYYLASVADQIWINPFGLISLQGLASNTPYLGETLKKYGIGVQTTRVGNYKSAVELFTRSNMSPADREQRALLLQDLWQSMLEDTAHARERPLQELSALSASDAFFTAEAAQNAQLVDHIGYLDELIDHLANSYAYNLDAPTFQQIELNDYASTDSSALTQINSETERIAVVYAEGEIIDGDQAAGYVGGDWLARELRRLRYDPEVKAVVLRINSPGGSAVASEIIQRETRLLAAAKPLVISMGSYAASGGYWIAAYADTIYAQPTTLTGSIGVFGLVFNIKEAAAKHAVQFDGVKTAPFADIHTLSRPRTDAEMALIQKFTDEIYTAFIARVADGRGISPPEVEELAQGRVWSGRRAQQLSLVDSMGGLKQAIEEAQRLGDLQTEWIEQVPAPSTLADSFAQLLEESGTTPLLKTQSPLEQLAKQWQALQHQLLGLNDPRAVYARMPFGYDQL